MPETQRLTRGDIWKVAGGKDYLGKPRPAVVVQDGSHDPRTGSFSEMAGRTRYR